jgi:predicted Zn-dependent protease
VRTHPLSRYRIDAIRRHLNKSRFTSKAISIKDSISHARIRAKLVGFTKSFSDTLREYPEPEGSIATIYARSIAYYRKPNIQEAIRLINKLIAKIPNDPYFHELKGQIYFENGKIDLALSSYQMASDLIPGSALLKAQLGKAQIEKNDPKFYRMAVQNLLYSVNKDPTRPNVWRQLGIAYGRLSKKGESSRALAEEAILLGRNKEAIRIAERAKRQFKIGSPNWLRAEDIRAVANNNIKRKNVFK